MVYMEMVLRVQVDWRTILGSWGGNVPPYQPSIFAMVANPSILPKTPSTLITFPLVVKHDPKFFLNSPLSLTFFFQPIPIVPKSTTPTSFCTQDPSLGISDQIVQCSWEQSLPIPNRPQAWGTNMKWIWKLSMYVITWGNQYYDNDNMMNPWFRKHVKYCTHQWPIHDAIGFINYFKGGLTQ